MEKIDELLNNKKDKFKNNLKLIEKDSETLIITSRIENYTINVVDEYLNIDDDYSDGINEMDVKLNLEHDRNNTDCCNIDANQAKSCICVII